MRDNDGRTIDRGVLEQIRIRVARQIVEEGVAAEDAAAVLGFSRAAVFAWAAQYRRGGVDALRSHPAPGRAPKLCPEQRVELGRLLRQDPRTLGFDRALWTRALVAQLIWQHFGVSLSVSAVGAMLRRMGWSVQRPVWRAREQDPKAVARWKTEDFPRIRAEAAEAGAQVFFADEAGIRFDDRAGTTWAPVGQAPVVTSTGRHVSTNLISAVAVQGAMWFAVYGESLNAARFIDFCRRLLDDVGGPVVLVVDGHPVHRARETTKFVAGTQGRLRLCFLPGYSPQLNPDEWVWKNAKHDRIGPAGLVDDADLQAKAEAAMRGLQQHPETIRGFFRDPDLAYITA